MEGIVELPDWVYIEVPIKVWVELPGRILVTKFEFPGTVLVEVTGKFVFGIGIGTKNIFQDSKWIKLKLSNDKKFKKGLFSILKYVYDIF